MLFSKADAKVMPLHQTTKSVWEKIANLSESFRLFDKIQPTDCNTHYLFTHARDNVFLHFRELAIRQMRTMTDQSLLLQKRTLHK